METLDGLASRAGMGQPSWALQTLQKIQGVPERYRVSRTTQGVPEWFGIFDIVRRAVRRRQTAWPAGLAKPGVANAKYNVERCRTLWNVLYNTEHSRPVWSVL